jgi:predicted alpha/beta hydrolase family esterase
MKSAYIIHGCCDKAEYFSNKYPSPSNFHWMPWLQKQLLMKGYDCQTPEMPKPYQAVYKDWKKAFDIYPVNTKTSLIGHSCSCGFFLRWLTDTGQKIDKLILVAPWIDPKTTKRGLNLVLGSDLQKSVKEMHVFHSSDDKNKGVQFATKIILDHYSKAHLHSYNDQGHFILSGMGTDKFPDLLALFD